MVRGEDGNGHKKGGEIIAKVENVSAVDDGDVNKKSEDVIDVIGGEKGNSSQ